MAGLGARLCSIILVFSLASCSATWHQTLALLGFSKDPPPQLLHPKPSPPGEDAQTLSELMKDETSAATEDEKGGAGSEEKTPVVQAEPTPKGLLVAPIHVSSGDKILKENGSYRTFIQYASPTVCKSGIYTKIAVFNANTAVLLVNRCYTITPEALRPQTFAFFPAEPTVMRYENKPLDLEQAQTAGHSATEQLTTKIICENSKDSAGRIITTVVKTGANESNLEARLTLKGSAAAPEVYEFHLRATQANGMNIFQSGQAGKQPFYAFLLGNYNGLTAFVSYDLNATQAISGAVAKTGGTMTANRKENNISLGQCYSR